MSNSNRTREFTTKRGVKVVIKTRLKWSESNAWTDAASAHISVASLDKDIDRKDMVELGKKATVSIREAKINNILVSIDGKTENLSGLMDDMWGEDADEIWDEVAKVADGQTLSDKKKKS